MKINYLEVQNFRKLKSTHIDFDCETTLFVGANNSGKTSAMLAMRYFLLSPGKLSLRDITVANWAKIDAIGRAWELNVQPVVSLQSNLPVMDVWLDVPMAEIHHVVHVLPTITWNGGLIGVRLQYEAIDLEKLRSDYVRQRLAAIEVTAIGDKKKGAEKLNLWPLSLTDFLSKNLARHLNVEAYSLDSTKFVQPSKGVAKPQELSGQAVALDKQPFKSLIKIDEIAAQRDFADAGRRSGSGGEDDKTDGTSKKFKRKLSEQLRSYYDQHLDPLKTPSTEDYDALSAIQMAERNFDDRLKAAFSPAFGELADLVGYPGIGDPKPSINTQLRATDGLRHATAVQYEIAGPAGDGSQALHLPEDYSGLGYQNLISMVFMLMSYRDEWLRLGKAGLNPDVSDDDHIQPLHLVLLEEPEAHLHAQVQQVFIKNAYHLLRNNENLNENSALSTQLIVSTHSSHIAHEVDFASLRYFRRRRAVSQCETPTTTVVNLSYVFGSDDKTQRFVKRYLKATHCDLFFADGVVFIEGLAERIIIPQLIRDHFVPLSRRYVTLLELGGSHAHKFKNLIDELGLTTLVIGDLDATKAHKKMRKDGVETTVWRAVKPETGRNQKTANPVLKDWHPLMTKIDDLMALDAMGHVATIEDDYDLYVAFQKAISIPKGGDDSELIEVIPRTFEDALVYSNLETFKTLSGSPTSKKLQEIVDGGTSGEELSDELFGWLKEAKKAEFALDCLMIEGPEALVPPAYIDDGLSWLQRTLEEKATDVLSDVAAKPAKKAGKKTSAKASKKASAKVVKK